MKRRHFLQGSAVTLTGIDTAISASNAPLGMRTREIPSSGEPLPVIGLGTWQTFDVGNGSDARGELAQVLKTLVDAGGSVVDSSPMYGRSETVVGDLAKAANITDKLFFATKVWTRGAAAGVDQMQRSIARMNAKPMDLMQVHNLLDAETHLDTLTQWKSQKHIRYVGITHYHQGGYAEMLRLMTAHELDFIQINYSMMSREAEKQILPLAADRKIAVLVNRPYDGGQLFKKVKDKPLPKWALEFDCTSWGQYFLKFILANTAVNCVIPGTSKVHHLEDNLAAGRGRLPNPEQLMRMAKFLDQ
jgi:aryl-alcohol dehydrogenase-like predicted oxidoreductase